VSDNAVLEVSGLVKVYETAELPVRALRGVDLVLERREFVAVMGPSGSGKSTLLNLIAGLDRPTDGDVVVASQSLSGADERQLALIRREHIGLVFQFFHLLEGMSVLENVVLPAVIAGESRRRADIRAHELLDLLGLTAKAAEMPSTLSGGQRQRLALARALANRPTLLLADEPTGALDSAGVEEVLGLLGRLHREGQTILLVTHDSTVAAAADRVVTMSDGRILDGDRASVPVDSGELRVSRMPRAIL
jgi:putative ABC transport system ATP-binding protein